MAYINIFLMIKIQIFLFFGNFDGFPKKENFDGLYKCFFDDKNAKFLFLDIFDGLHNDGISFLGNF